MRLGVGPLNLELAFGAQGLREIQLSAQVPAGLTREILEETRLRLSRFELEPDGASDFRRRVWSHLALIPVGEVRSYSAVSAALGLQGGARAVAAACASNRLLLLVPCHRVVGVAGLGGYNAGLEWKRALLHAESAV